MKSLLPRSLVLFVLSYLQFNGIDSVDAALLLNYQLGQAGPQVQDSVNTAAGGNLTTAGGLTAFTLTANDGYTTAPNLHVNPPNGATDAGLAYTANSWFFFNVTAGSNVADLDLTSVSFDVAKGGATGTRGFGIRMDTPTTSNEIINASTTITNVRTTFQNYSFNLTGFSSVQNLTAGQVMRFEIAVFTPNSGSSLEFDNFVVNGNVTAIPEPGVISVLLLGCSVLLAQSRRKRAPDL